MSGFYHFNPPCPDDYNSDGDYQDAVDAWESAEDDYVEDYLERERMERYN